MTPEKTNFLKLSHILVDIVLSHLRKLFIKTWNEKYKHMIWENNKTSGDQLLRSLGENFTKSNDLEEKMKTGDVGKWDITLLCKIFRFSNLKFDKDSSEGKEINNIREIRNEFFAHRSSLSCSVDEFEKHITRIKTAVRKLFGENTERKISAIEKSPIDQKMIEESKLIGKRLLIIFHTRCIL